MIDFIWFTSNGKGRIGTFCELSNFRLSLKGFKPKYPTPSLKRQSSKTYDTTALVGK